MGQLLFHHSNQSLGPRGPAGGSLGMPHTLLHPQLSPIGLYSGPIDPLVNTYPRVLFRTHHQSATSAISNVLWDRPVWPWHSFPLASLSFHQWLQPSYRLKLSFLHSILLLQHRRWVPTCLAGAAELGVDVAGPSLTVCPLVATMVVLFRSGFRLCLSLYRHDAGLTLGST